MCVRSASACAQLCNALATGPQPEQCAVELTQQRTAIAVQQHGNEQPPHEIDRRCPELLDERRPLLRRLTEQRSRTHPRGVQPLAVPESRIQRLPELLAAERIVLEQGKLPAVQRVAELRIVVSAGQRGP